MTCIIALKCKNNIYLGADRAILNANLDCSKLVNENGVLVGFSGARSIILRCLEVIPASIIFNARVDNEDGMLSMIEELREHFYKTYPKELWIDDKYQVNFLLTTGKKLFFVGLPSFIISPLVDEYYATGSGYPYALGALYATNSISDPEQRIKIALEAASKWDSGNVRPPFDIDKL